MVDGATLIAIRQARKALPATLVAFDPKHDIAILRVPGLDQPKVVSRPSSLVKVGEHVYAIGAPRGLELSLSDGLIAALRPDKNKEGKETGVSILQTTAPISPGSSGGGLFDVQGRLVGITTYQAEGQNLNFAHPADWIAELITGTAPAEGSSPPRAPPLPSLSKRPEALRCKVQTKATWGLFSSGDEMLDSKAISGTWEFANVHTQTPRLVEWSGSADGLALVLADINRDAGTIRFKPISEYVKSQYFFSVDDEGRFAVTRLDPINFHGQLRVDALSGRCEIMTTAEARGMQTIVESPGHRCRAGDADACLIGMRAVGRRDPTAALGLALKGCDLRSREACIEAARLCETIGHKGEAETLWRRVEGMPADDLTAAVLRESCACTDLRLARRPGHDRDRKSANRRSRRLERRRSYARSAAPPRLGFSTDYSYRGYMKVVKTADAKNNLSRYLAYVRRGGRVRILDRDEPVADLVPVRADGAGGDGDGDDEALLASLERRGIVRRGESGAIPRDLLRPGPRVATDAAALLIEERGKRG